MPFYSLQCKHNRDTGAALLGALLIVAIVSASTSWLIYSQNLNIQRTSQIIQHEQAQLLLISLEEIIKALLQEDFRKSSTLDSYPLEEVELDLWAFPKKLDTTLLPLPNVEVSWCVFDAQGFINVNNLGAKSKSTDTSSAGNWYAERLLMLFQSEKIESPLLFVDPLRDWLDSDDNLRSFGAENAQYSFASPPYQAANSRISHIYELYFIQNIRLLPTRLMNSLLLNLIALPDSELTMLNINTAHHSILNTLPLPEAMGAETIKSHIHNNGPFIDSANFRDFLLSFLPPDHEYQSDWVEQYISTASNFFLLHGSISFNNANMQINSLLYRNPANGGETSVVQRDFGSNPYLHLNIFAQGGDCLTPTNIKSDGNSTDTQQP